MMVMGQPFSIIMTGIGIVALAGIVVNNNIVLIDTFQTLRKEMPPLEAIVETGRQRLRPVLLTTVTTIAGLLPMMFAVSIDFLNGGISTGAPSALWWTQLATAIVFGLGFATMLTLFVTPSLLALRIWYFGKIPAFGWRGAKAALLKATVGGKARFLRDRRVRKTARKLDRDVIWSEVPSFLKTPPAKAAPAVPKPDEELGYLQTLMASVKIDDTRGGVDEPFPRDPDAPRPRSAGYTEAAE
jgi:multidrug efflux pump